MKRHLLLTLFSCSFIFSIAQPVAFTGCPANNVDILRAGNNNSTANPISIYNVNTATGAVGGAAFYRLKMVDENGLAKYSASKNYYSMQQVFYLPTTPTR